MDGWEETAIVAMRPVQHTQLAVQLTHSGPQLCRPCLLMHSNTQTKPTYSLQDMGRNRSW